LTPDPSPEEPSGGVLKAIVSDSVQPIPIAPGDSAQPLTAPLRAAGLGLNTRCAEHGRCSGCLVDLLDGALTNLATGEVVEAQNAPRRIRACQFRLVPPRGATIRIPVSSLLAGRAQIVSRFALRTAYELRPLYRVLHLGREELQAIGPGAAALERALARRLQVERVRLGAPAEALSSRAGTEGLYVAVERWQDEWAVAAVTAGQPPRPIGAAVDIGTTTVVVCVVDLETGQILGEASAFNAQLPFGEDVLTRIESCSRHPTMLARLQHAVAGETLVALLHEACAAGGVPPADLHSITVAGNTTMLHLLAGVDPTPIGVSPFTPAFLAHRAMRWGDLCAGAAAAASPAARPETHRGDASQFARAAVHLLPGAAAYIGADIVAGVLASGLAADAGPSLLIDLGTNGEIVLKNGAELLGCSTAAGPAFEGVGLRCGMRAMEGAVSHVKLAAPDYTAELSVIGDKPPAGLCGSAYIDFLAEARRVGLLNQRGRLAVEPRGAGASGPMTLPGVGRAVVLAAGGDGHPIVVTEADVAKLLPAKAAIAAGVQTLLETVGLSPPQIARLYLAGGFGVHLDVSAAIACGLLPGFAPGQVVPVGNTALGGAYLALLDHDLLTEMERIRQRIRIVELNRTPGFESRFIRNMRLP